MKIAIIGLPNLKIKKIFNPSTEQNGKFIKKKLNRNLSNMAKTFRSKKDNNKLVKLIDLKKLDNFISCKTNRENNKITEDFFNEKRNKNKYLSRQNESQKIVPIKGNTILSKLNLDPSDDIKKFNYYQKIDFLKSKYSRKSSGRNVEQKKENKYIEFMSPTDMENMKFYRSSIRNSTTLKNSIADSITTKKVKQFCVGEKTKKELNDSIFYFLKQRNMKKINMNFKHKSLFIRYIIEKFLYMENNFLSDNKLHRRLYIVLDGTIIMNEKHIKGCYIDFPINSEIKKVNTKTRQEIYKKLLENLNEIFQLTYKLKNIFSPNQKILTDLIEIKDKYLFLYVSNNAHCSAVELIMNSRFEEIYKTEFNYYLYKKKLNNKGKTLENDIESDNDDEECIEYKEIKLAVPKFKSFKTSKGIRPKAELLKRCYSFSAGETEIIHEDYLNFTGNPEEIEEIQKNIEIKCINKNDFFLYINDISYDKKINCLKKKLINDIPDPSNKFDFYESYKQFECDYDKMLERYKKEIYKKLKINPELLFKEDLIRDNIKANNLFNPNDKWNNIFIKNKIIPKIILKNSKHKTFYHNLDKRVSNYYSHFFLYNIPKIMSELKNFSRRRLYEIFAQFKDLLSISYGMKKDDFILKYGIDFNTFWKCVDEISDEKKEFVQKLFNQINTNKYCLLNMRDFFKGMYFIQNSDLQEKIDLFLKALDEKGSGELSYDEVIKICKESIKRSLSAPSTKGEGDEILKELSLFFAGFVFKLIGVDKGQKLKISLLKEAIISNVADAQYLHMFCGAN